LEKKETYGIACPSETPDVGDLGFSHRGKKDRPPPLGPYDVKKDEEDGGREQRQSDDQANPGKSDCGA